MSMKMIVEKVFAAYPAVDLQEKRGFIKSTVKDVVGVGVSLSKHSTSLQSNFTLINRLLFYRQPEVI